MKKNELLDLRRYMYASDREELERLIKDERTTYDTCKIFANNAITSRQIAEKTYSLNQSEDMEYREYIDQLSPEDQIWVRKFYNEMYANRIFIPEENRIIQSEEMLKESNRINNMRNRDLFEVKKNRRQLDSLENPMVFDEIAEEDLDWHVILDMFGYEEAMNFIMDQTFEELSHNGLDERLTLVRFYIKMNKLKKEMGQQGFREAIREIKNEQA